MNQIFRAIILVVILALFGVRKTSGFMAAPPIGILGQRITQQRGRWVYHSAVMDSSFLTLSAEESWRQYVPLVVSVGIIIDILLGNPLASAVLKPMRPEEESGGEEKDKKANRPKSKARIDAELVARQALDKANNTLELRKFLDERKTDYDRMEDMKRELDSSMQDLDEDLEARQKTIDERKTK